MVREHQKKLLCFLKHEQISKHRPVSVDWARWQRNEKISHALLWQQWAKKLILNHRDWSPSDILSVNTPKPRACASHSDLYILLLLQQPAYLPHCRELKKFCTSHWLSGFSTISLLHPTEFLRNHPFHKLPTSIVSCERAIWYPWIPGASNKR